MNLKRWIVVAVSLFAAGIILGLTARGAFPDFLTGNLSGLRDLASQLGPFKISTALFILMKNVFALLMSFALSPLLLLFPVLVLVLNGALLAFVALLGIQQRSLGFILAAILPHGVIELTAVMIGEAAAFSFGVSALAALFSPKRRADFLPGFKRNLKFLGFACALLVPAALIETFITPLLILE